MLYLCGRAATPPIRTAREASAKLPGETSANVCGAESTMRVQLRAVSNQLPGVNRGRRIRCQRRPRAPGTSFAFAPPCSPRPYGSAKPSLSWPVQTPLPFPMPDTIGTGCAKHKMSPRRDVNQAVNVTDGRGCARVRISRAPRAAPLIRLGGARANGMMAARAFADGFCAHSGAVQRHDGSA